MATSLSCATAVTCRTRAGGECGRGERVPRVFRARVVASGRRSGRELTACAPRLRAEQPGTISYYRCKWCDAEFFGSTAACIRNHITGKRVCLFLFFFCCAPARRARILQKPSNRARHLPNETMSYLRASTHKRTRTHAQVKGVTKGGCPNPDPEVLRALLIQFDEKSASRQRNKVLKGQSQTQAQSQVAPGSPACATWQPKKQR